MEKPVWQVRASEYVVKSPYMRLRRDEVVLPNGTVIEDYYVRESDGFAIIFALTESGDVLLGREYRYGADAIGYELPAGTLSPGEDPLDCARRELREETGYDASTFEEIGNWYAEPVRSDARCYAYLARGARYAGPQILDPSEHIEVEEVSLEELRAMLGDGRMHSISSIAVAYRALAILAAR